ncbi:MAG: hypothetical protein IT208_17670 [Chthonomonadales bacterium]|nr:hypothetical protein [Chthonomonadales bacterium]
MDTLWAGAIRAGRLAAAAGAVLAALAGTGRRAAAEPGEATPRARGAHALTTVGLYVSPPGADRARYLDFYRACGYNYLEFCDGGFGQRPDLLARYYAGMADAVRAARAKGFRVWILLLAGMRQWKGPGEAGSAGTFSALDADLRRERLACIRRAVEALNDADGFVFFAGDPGGDPEGRSTVKDCMVFAREVRGIVRASAPRVGFVVNLWAVAEWAGFPSPFGLEFWRKQAALTREVAAEPDLLGPACGVAFSLDGYYRSLTLACYAAAGLSPDRYPTAAAVRDLRRRGVKAVLGWPYFLVDEVDDGFITPNNVASGGQAGSEARYIRAIVERGRALELDGLVANATYVAAEALNLWTFGQMCRHPRLSPAAALDGFARIVADGPTCGTLARVLRFMENHGNWQHSLPEAYRLRGLANPGVASAGDALRLLDTVVPRHAPPIALPEEPARYLARVRARLEAIAAGRIGGVAPILGAPKAP